MAKKKKVRVVLQKKRAPILIMVFFGLLMFYIGIINHYLFKTFTYDYANYNFAFWDYSHFRISPLPTFRGNFLQDHFSFTLMYFIPLYWVLNWLTGSYTLIIIQTLLILLAAWYSHKLLKLKTDNNLITSGVLLFFFLLFGRYSAFATDVNLAIMSACFVPIFLYYFEIRKYTIAFLILILSLFSRENIPIWFIFIFITLIILNWKDKKAVLFSLIGIFTSTLYFIFLFKVFIPNTETPGVEYALFNYSALGAGPGDAILYIIQHPIESIKLFFVNHLDNPDYNLVKFEFYWVYFISGGFILLLRPKYLIWFIPIVAQKVLNDDFFRWGIATYYSIEVATLLPLSVFLVIVELKKEKLQSALVILSCVGALGMTIHKMDRSNHQVPWTFYKSKINFYSKSFYETPFHISKVNQILKKIPKDAKVSASNRLGPHLAQRQFIYFFPTVKDAEYIVFSVFDDNYLMSEEENEKHREMYLTSPEWEIIEKAYPVFLLKKRDRIASNLPLGLVYHSTTDTLRCTFENFNNETKHILFSNGQKADTLNHLSTNASFSDHSSICLTENTPYSHGVAINNSQQLKKLEATVWIKGNPSNAYIVIDNTKGYYRNSNTVIEREDGWQKLSLNHRLPESIDFSKLIIYLWNAGSSPIYFDDFEVIKQYE